MKNRHPVVLIETFPGFHAAKPATIKLQLTLLGAFIIFPCYAIFGVLQNAKKKNERTEKGRQQCSDNFFNLCSFPEIAAVKRAMDRKMRVRRSKEHTTNIVCDCSDRPLNAENRRHSTRVSRECSRRFPSLVKCFSRRQLFLGTFSWVACTTASNTWKDLHSPST